MTVQQQVRGPLSAAVARLCTELRPRLGADAAAGVDEVLERLTAPLQLAVVGRVASGKSTLVNALIGRNVAPTDVGECTRVVTRFRYGTVDRIEVVLLDGTTHTLPFTQRAGVPADLGVDRRRVSHVEVYLTNAVLRDLTVIDTPGLGSLDESSVARAEAVLGAADGTPTTGERLDPVSRRAVLGAEAVLYVLTQSARADDRHALDTFGAATGERPAGPANAVGVLNKADTVEPDSAGDGQEDPWSSAEALAAEQARLLTPKVTDVVPLIALLAETAESPEFTDADATALHQLARLDPATRQTMLLSGDLFTEWECAVPADTRERLLRLLDLYGIRCALEEIDADPTVTAGRLREALRRRSGLPALRARVNSVFRGRADGIKAAAGLASLAAVARCRAGERERRMLHDGIEALLTQPQAHQLRLLEALTTVSSGEVELPADLLDEVLRLGSSEDFAERLGMPGAPAERMREFALERARWWRSFASLGSTPAQSRVAHVVHRAYFLIWRQLRGTSG
ncbi:dynamin family protein [Actinopolyspora mortivallis]|uniref:GTPase n=1 Tax=Actinopolyspora mortivallis TaxID=33906 RepID=A0A2T0GRF0_ACTMO|nr:dynamin family protein [Actinopolyspora mortivallis]PRW61685.1 GTPase [Actinopolyspora mortivallis]